MRHDTITLTRSQLGGWAGFIGGAALLVGLLGWLWQGSLANFVGAALLVGASGVLLWALLNPRDALNLVTGRQARHGTVAVLSTFVLIGIVVLTYLLVYRSVIVIDMTQSQRFSLSDETLGVLRQINRPLRITGFYSARALPVREVDDQFFQLYSTATDGLITREYIDPEEQPALAQRFGVQQDAAVFISYLNPDGSVDFDTIARVPRSGTQERDLTEAISRLLIAGEITVLFEVGHGGLDPTDGGQSGLSGINNGIRESGLITYPLDLVELTRGGGSIPPEAAAVILPRPVAPFAEETVAIIDEYLQSGGALFIMADPIFRETAFLSEDTVFNQYLWDNYGLRTLDAVVVDFQASGQTALDIIGAAVFGGTAISERLDPETEPLFFRVARALAVDDSPPPDVANGRVVMTSELSYGETNFEALAETNSYEFDEGSDLPGPLTTVAWAWNQENDSRILLVGDSDFATNGQVLAGGTGNAILFTDGLSWLTGFGDRVSFGTRFFSVGLPLVVIEQSTLDAIAFISIIVLPGSLLLAGVVVWLRRLRQ